MNSFLELDQITFLFVSQALRFAPLDIFFLKASDFTVWIGVLVIFSILVYFKDKEREKLALFLAAALLSVGLTELLVSGFLKELIGRERPCHLYEQFEFVAGCTGSFSFPSAHATNSFAVAIALTFFYHKFWIPAIACAAIIAFSRVYLGVHYPSDVIAGAVLGTILGFFIATLLDTLFKRYKDKTKEVKY